MKPTVRSYLSEIGRRGGSRQTPAQKRALAAGRKRGGWPKGRPRKLKPT